MLLNLEVESTQTVESLVSEIVWDVLDKSNSKPWPAKSTIERSSIAGAELLGRSRDLVQIQTKGVPAYSLGWSRFRILRWQFKPRDSVINNEVTVAFIQPSIESLVDAQLQITNHKSQTVTIKTHSIYPSIHRSMKEWAHGFEFEAIQWLDPWQVKPTDIDTLIHSIQ